MAKKQWLPSSPARAEGQIIRGKSVFLQIVANVAVGKTAHLGTIPEPKSALFGTGYLGYTVARTWGKARGFDK